MASSDASESAVEPSAPDRVRAIALSLPGTSERLSHGSPAFFVGGKRCFAMVLDDHHGDGRLALWCAAPDGVQADMVATEPDRFFRPPYVGHRGWLGVLLPTVTDEELAAVVREAFGVVAPARLVRGLGGQAGNGSAERSPSPAG